ncbi:MarR family transcriptional regulator [Geosporobacter ferrireducens]|uniref:MarR family transcriptional regulator n=2 Tax=Geosporobacter ferrireducens TaxID=1424294 RepID=A0A1D8GQ28_9FIRM|nr:MarR family transcriptional regulator [Geosporobacter ferrireducens]MTI56913.1 MarR family transcriptional regulator [Geosporobacter ferrireducens]
MIQRLVRVFQLIERDQIKIFGVTSTQCYCLLELLKVERLTMNEISHKMNLDTSTMTRVIDKLVRDQMISRERQEEDRRIVVLELTEKGKDVALQLNQSIRKYYKNIIQNLPEGQVENVLNAVFLLLNAFDKANPNCC